MVAIREIISEQRSATKTLSQGIRRLAARFHGALDQKNYVNYGPGPGARPDQGVRDNRGNGWALWNSAQ